MRSRGLIVSLMTGSRVGVCRGGGEDGEQVTASLVHVIIRGVFSVLLSFWDDASSAVYWSTHNHWATHAYK